MISMLSGTVVGKAKGVIVVETAGGVGYDVHMSALAAFGYQEGQKATLYTFLKVGENALDLYGFATNEARNFFTLLMTVSGVGPKTAMNILSLGTIAEIQSAIARGDVKYLTAVSGLGQKTAERLVVELKTKVHNSTPGRKNEESDVLSEVMDALVGMGYSKEEAKGAAVGVDLAGLKTEEALRFILKELR